VKTVEPRTNPCSGAPDAKVYDIAARTASAGIGNYTNLSAKKVNE